MRPSDLFDANVYAWMDTFSGDDVLDTQYSHNTAWLFGGSGNDVLEATEDFGNAYTTVCNGGADGDDCFWCDNSPNECEADFP